jgi:hypothetical protein
MSDIDGNLPIHLAMQNGCSKYLEKYIAMQDENLVIVEHLLEMYPESASKSNLKGEFPLHFAIQCHSPALINRLLITYPSSASMINSCGHKILHFAMARNDHDAEIVTCMCTQYPNLIHGVSKCGYTPLHHALSIWNFKGATAICKVDRQMIKDVVNCTNFVHSTVRTQLFNPLHMIMMRGNFPAVSEGADCFRLFINL